MFDNILVKGELIYVSPQRLNHHALSIDKYCFGKKDLPKLRSKFLKNTCEGVF